MQAGSAGIRLVAGLGNPGPEYDRTRHNVGFAVLDRVAREGNAEWQRAPKWGAVWTKLEQTLLVKPMTYMNRSGEALAAVASFYKIIPEEVLVVLDDTALEIGRLRLRMEGGTGGHNGLDSVIIALGTDKIPRLRFGVGAAPVQGSVDYVLGRFFEEEITVVSEGIDRASKAVKWAIDKGMLSAMNTFNKIPES